MLFVKEASDFGLEKEKKKFWVHEYMLFTFTYRFTHSKQKAA